MAVEDWSTTAAGNTTVGTVNIAEGMSPSGVNNAIREVMAQVRQNRDTERTYVDAQVGGVADDVTALEATSADHETRIGDAETDIIGLSANFPIGFGTWTELAAVTVTATGQMAQVRGDAGTHTDPVTSGTVDNEGIYSGVLGTGWERIDDLYDDSAALEVIAARGTYGDLDARLDADDLRATIHEEVAAPTLNLGDFTTSFPQLPSTTKVKTDAASDTTDLTVSVSSGLVLVRTNNTGYIAQQTQYTYVQGPCTIRADFTITTLPGTGQIAVALGDGTARRWYVWSSSGTFSWFTNADVSTTLVDSSVGLSFAQGDEVSIQIDINADQTGRLTITDDAGAVRTREMSAIPVGALSLGSRSSSTVTVTELAFSGTTGILLGRPDRDHYAGAAVGDWSDTFSDIFGLTKLVPIGNADECWIRKAVSGIEFYRTGLPTRTFVVSTRLTTTPAPLKIEVDFDLTTEATAGTPTNQVCVAVGSGTATRYYVYSNSGASAYYDYQFNLLGVLIASSAGHGWTEGDSVTIRLEIGANRTGTFTAIDPDGDEASASLTDIPTGQFWVGVRLSPDGVITMTEMRVTGQATQTYAALQAIDGGGSSADTLYRISSRILPNYPDPRPAPAEGDPTPGPGWTCTGLNRITRGLWSGCWLVCDDGRLVEDDTSDYSPAVHVLDMDFTQIIHTFDFSSIWTDSIQGVGVDTSGSEETFWVTCYGDETIRHFYLYDGSGHSAGDEITGDRFDWGAAGFSGFPNALDYDAEDDSLIVGSTSTTVRRISCNPAASPRVLNTWTFGSSIDHIHIDRSNNDRIYYSPPNSSGGTFVDDTIWLRRLSTGSETLLYTLPYCRSLEGFYIDRDNATLYGVSDGGYHVSRHPAINMAVRYHVPLVTT